MKIDFEKLDLEQAQKLIKDARAEADEEGAAENTAFDSGDHWQKGKAWTGPVPPDTDPQNPASMPNVEREFAGKNAIGDVIGGHLDGVISREPEWSFGPRRALKAGEQPSEAEQALIDEAEAALTDWWNERRTLKTLQESARGMLSATRHTLSIYVPPANLVENPATGERAIPQGDLATSLSRIYLLDHAYEQAGVFRDDRSMQQVGVYVYDEDDKEFAELTFVNADGLTVSRKFSKEKNKSSTAPGDNRKVTVEETTLPLGGRLVMFEISRPPLITEQMRESQKQLNKAKTLRGHNLNLAGFREINLLNVELPGTLQDDPNREGGKVFVPDPILHGGGIINSWIGYRYQDKEGNWQVASPSIHESEPSPISVFIESERADYRDVLEEGKQVHRLMAADATASGLSRIQARAIYETSLLPTKSELDAAVRWILETVLTMAAVFMGEPERFAELRANADSQLDTGPADPQEITTGIELVKQGVWSKARLQRLTGVEDVDAEAAIIEAEEERATPPQLQNQPPAQPPANVNGNGQPPVDGQQGEVTLGGVV